MKEDLIGKIFINTASGREVKVIGETEDYIVACGKGEPFHL